MRRKTPRVNQFSAVCVVCVSSDARITWPAPIGLLRFGSRLTSCDCSLGVADCQLQRLPMSMPMPDWKPFGKAAHTQVTRRLTQIFFGCRAPPGSQILATSLTAQYMAHPSLDCPPLCSPVPALWLPCGIFN